MVKSLKEVSNITKGKGRQKIFERMSCLLLNAYSKLLQGRDALKTETKQKKRTVCKQPRSCYLENKTVIFSQSRQEKILKLRYSLGTKIKSREWLLNYITGKTKTKFR